MYRTPKDISIYKNITQEKMLRNWGYKKIMDSYYKLHVEDKTILLELEVYKKYCEPWPTLMSRW